MDYNLRLERLRRKMSRKRLDCLLVPGEENVNYLSGFSGDSGWALVTKDRAFLITDFRYREQAEAELDRSFQLIEGKGGRLIEALEVICRDLRVRSLGFEEEDLNYALYQKLKSRLKGRQLKPQGSWVTSLRMVKDREEILLLKKSALLTCQILAQILPSLKEGMTEAKVVNQIISRIRKRGGKEAFEPIVAVGLHSSQPHAASSGKVLEAKSILLVDLGVKLQEYHSDMTRTFVLNDFPRRFKKIYQLVLKAQKKALDAIAPGVKTSLVDGRARGYLEAEGYGSYFGHALGHGVGLGVHESPLLNAESNDTLEEGMVFTVEPGIYLPGWGGIRIEDTVLVTADGCEVLTQAPKDLSSVVINLHKQSN